MSIKNKLQQVGKSLLLPVSVFPIIAILTGIGYSLEQFDNSYIYFIAIILKTAGEALLALMPMTFAIGVAYGLSNRQDGFSAFYGLLTFLIIVSLLSTDAFHLNVLSSANSLLSFKKIDNQFIGILSGIVASLNYNFYSKRNYSTINFHIIVLTSIFLCSIGTALILYFIWPFIYNLLVDLGTIISGFGPLGAGVYAFFNRLLIPIGMHHTLNSVFWFDLIGINDIGNFWASTGTYGVVGMYQAGFFPIMMFGLPGVALAMLKSSYPENKEKVKPFLLSAAFASFFTGVTEPLEFSFMFIAPKLYLLHAVFTGISVFIAAQFQWIAGFSFSAGYIDFLLSLNMPFSRFPLMLVVQGIFFFFLYYFTFNYVIKKYNIHTLGREEVETTQGLSKMLTENEAKKLGIAIINGCGGLENIITIDCCITRIRLQLKQTELFHFNELKELGAIEHLTFGNEIQIVFGPQAEYIFNALQKLYENNIES